MPAAALNDAFWRKEYKTIVARYVDTAAPAPVPPGGAPLVIGALAFLGRVDEAATSLAVSAATMGAAERIEARFYLGIAYRRLRAQNFTRLAARLFAENLAAARATSDDRSRFFACQGLAFHRYVEGRVANARRWAERAYSYAFRAGFPYGRVLAYDLKGHAQIAAGLVGAGLESLRCGAALAREAGFSGSAHAVDITALVYRASHGIGGLAVLDELDAAIKRCDFEDNFRLANLHLERARLAQLCGQHRRAARSVEDASHCIYRLDHPVLEAQLSLRLAALSAPAAGAEALAAIRSVRKRLSAADDLRLEAQALGMEHGLLRKLGRSSEAALLEPRLRWLERRSGAAVIRRQNRRALGPLPGDDQDARRFGEDPLGELLDDAARRGADAVPDVLASGFLGLLPAALGLAPRARALVFGLQGESTTVFDAGDIRHDAGGWPRLVRRLLERLARGEASKDEIVRAVWAQDYHPLRHDPLIYALVARTRRLLESAEAWVQAGDGTYRLAPGVEIVVPPPVGAPDAAPVEAPDTGLSYRQAAILELCRRDAAVTNRRICQEFQVSEITASRDLAVLAKLGAVQRTGRGRATAYVAACL